MAVRQSRVRVLPWAGIPGGAALLRLAGAGCLGLAVPAGAATYDPPEGCTLTMTVQQRSCTVAQHYTCAADAPGDQWVAYLTQEGLVYRTRIDAETRWVESTDMTTGVTDHLEPGGKDDASLTALLSAGRDDFDFWTVSDDGDRLHHVGHDELTGTTVIDGRRLDTTRFALDTLTADGDLLIRRTGTQYVSRESGRFYGGLETAVDWTGEETRTDDTPVLFILPGEPGFASTEPAYDCQVQMVRAADPDAVDLTPLSHPHRAAVPGAAAEKEPSA